MSPSKDALASKDPTNPEEVLAAGRAALAALGVPGDVWLLRDGYNQVFGVRSKQFGAAKTYAFRHTRLGPGESAIKAEIDWMNRLAGTSWVRVPRVVTWSMVDGRACLLFEWLEGEQVTEPKAAHLEMLGEVMARFHDHGTSQSGERPCLDEVFLGAPDPLPWLDQHHPQRAPVFADVAARVAPVLEACVSTRRILLHADLHMGNLKWQAGAPLGVLDFDDMAWGHPMQDIAISLYYVRRRASYSALEAGLRKGYEKVASWPLAERTRDALWQWRTLSLLAATANHQSPLLRSVFRKRLPQWHREAQTWLEGLGPNDLPG